MSAADDNDNNNGDDNDKGERKRQREKKRRSDLATAFEELQVVFNIVEPPSVVYNRATTESEAADGGNATRLELIRKTTEALRRLHQENMDMRRAMGGHRTDETMVTVSIVQRSYMHESLCPPLLFNDYLQLYYKYASYLFYPRVIMAHINIPFPASPIPVNLITTQDMLTTLLFIGDIHCRRRFPLHMNRCTAKNRVDGTQVLSSTCMMHLQYQHRNPNKTRRPTVDRKTLFDDGRRSW